MEANIENRSSIWKFRGSEDYVKDWFLMGSPYPALLILGSYLFFVLRLGPKYMENRPPYKLRYTMFVYNVIQVAMSCYMFKVAIIGLNIGFWFWMFVSILVCVHGTHDTGFSSCGAGAQLMYKYGFMENHFCALENETTRNEFLNGSYLYWIAKITEFLDTVFFVLRKKSNQVTFLHVYHHSIAFFITWIVMKYEPSYSLAFMGEINCFVHIIMYTYYALSAFPRLQKYLWWKKYITKLQLIQFALILIYVVWNYNVTTCPTSYLLISLTWSQAVIFLYLFTDFYYKNYKQKSKEDKDIKTGEEKKNNLSSSIYAKSNASKLKTKYKGT